MDQSPSIGFIGLGIMGGAISKNLLKVGHRVIGYDVSAQALEQFQANGGQVAKSILEVANTAKVLFTSLPTEKVVREVFTGEGGICHSQLDNIVMELSTMPLTLKMEMYQAMLQVNKQFMDCPVSGTGAQATTGDLIVFASGEKTAYETVRSIFPGMSKSNYYLGECGNGSKMKYRRQIYWSVFTMPQLERYLLWLVKLA
jgi:3-hydroxyisobutyrate dehydrogenase-like beta-hydroxyacid dehydrogenase